ncbi:MAG TPA: hypothetical protein VNJ07_03270, partial [Chitinophagales bacterium]|nr:hypothetical protein [Chitinophagales bacterium]
MKFWRVFVIAALLFLLLLSLRVLHYYFGNFYTASWEDYKRWYPRFYFIVFPAVKILPFAAGGCFVWLIRKHLLHAYSLVSKSIDRFLVNPLRAFPLKRYAVNLTVALLTVTMLLVLSEYALRKAGYKPDIRINSPYFMPVDSLYELSGFYADSNGILCISAEAAEFIGREIQSKNNEAELTPLRANQSPEVFYLRNHFLVLREKNYESEFKTFVESLDSLADTEDSEFVHAIHSYVLSPINSSGFKSIEFKKYNPKRKSILLLGDSFTWGHSAANITDC